MYHTLQSIFDSCVMVDDIYSSMAEAVHGSKLVLCLVSPQYISSANCNREVAVAADNGKQMIRVNVDPESSSTILGPIGLVSSCG